MLFTEARIQQLSTRYTFQVGYVDTEVDDLPLITICPKPPLKYVHDQTYMTLSHKMNALKILRDFLKDLAGVGPGKVH